MAESEPKSVFDTVDDPAWEAEQDALADAEIEAGLGVPHDRVKEWLEAMGRGLELPPPTR